MSALTLKDVMDAVESLGGEMRAEIAALKAEVAALKAHQDAEVDDETMAMLAAAVTSFLGKRVRIRSARRTGPGLEGAASWARHGRAAIQTSHELHRGH